MPTPKDFVTLRLPTADRYLLSYVHTDTFDFAFGIGAVLCILAARKQADGMQNFFPQVSCLLQLCDILVYLRVIFFFFNFEYTCYAINACYVNRFRKS